MRRLRFALYVAVLRWLPASTMPGGGVGLRLRRWCVTPLLARAGSDINVEHGALFGGGGSVELGDRSGIGINCRLHGPVRIGNDVMMGPNVTIHALSHTTTDTARPMREQGFDDPRPVVVGDDVWIGEKVIILPGVHVGPHSILGAGAVVRSDVPAYSVVAGNPARVIRDRREARNPSEGADVGQR
jgi:maltose O-acetyltransferase